jgi:hypothetical protein
MSYTPHYEIIALYAFKPLHRIRAMKQ